MKDEQPSLLKPAIDIGPVLVFFVAYYGFGDLMPATGLFIGATLIALALGWKLEGRLALMPIVSAVVVVVFGGLTLVLDDPRFIKLKPTIVYGLFAAVLFAGLLLRRPLLAPLFGTVWQLDEEGWWQLTLRFALFFVAMAALNEAIWRNFSTDLWVNFKLFGFIPLTFVFIAFQAPLLKRHGVAVEADGHAGDADD